MTPLVLVHGFLGGAAQWDGLIERIADSIDVIAVDLPGFGANADLPPINRIEGFADWVIATLRARGVERYHLLGHSMGGMIVQEMARRDPQWIDTLVLYATGSIGVLPGRFETITESKRRASVDGPQATARRIAATWFLEREAAPGYAACAAIAELAGLAAMHAGLDAMEAWSGADRLREIAQPTTVIWGDEDRTYKRPQIDVLVQNIPDAQLIEVPGCSHAIHLEKPDQFANLLLAALGLEIGVE